MELRYTYHWRNGKKSTILYNLEQYAKYARNYNRCHPWEYVTEISTGLALALVGDYSQMSDENIRFENQRIDRAIEELKSIKQTLANVSMRALDPPPLNPKG